MKLGKTLTNIGIYATAAAAVSFLPFVSAHEGTVLRGLKAPPEDLPEQAKGEPQNPNPNPIVSLDLPDQSKVNFYEPVEGILVMDANAKGQGLGLLDSYGGGNDPEEIYKFLTGSNVIPGQLQAAIARSKNPNYGVDTSTTPPPDGANENSGEDSDLVHDRRHRSLGISESSWINTYCKGWQYEISSSNCYCLTFRTGGAYWQDKSEELFMRTHAYDGGLQQRLEWWDGSQWVLLGSDWVSEGYTYSRSAWHSNVFWWKMSIDNASGDKWHSFWHKKDSLCCDRETGLCIKPLTCSLTETCPRVI